MHAVGCLGPRRWIVFVPAAVAVMVLAGCGGSKTCSIRGKVVYEDDQSVAEELAGYTVTLESVEQDVSAAGIIRADGTFGVSTYEEGDGAVPGRHRVAITPPIQEVDGPPPEPLIDPRYAKFDTSGLEVTVEKRKTEVVLAVQRAQP